MPPEELPGASKTQCDVNRSDHSAGFVCDASSRTPGPMVVAMVAFLMYRPLAAAGFNRSTSSNAAK